jgi:hypothetical protein
MIDQYESVEQFLLRTFTWLRDLSLTFCPPQEIQLPEEDDLPPDARLFPYSPPQFKSIHEAQLFLTTSIQQSSRFVASVMSRKYSFEILPEDEVKHAQIMALLDSLDFSIQNFLLQNYCSINPKEWEALALSRINFKTCWIIYRTILAIEESVFDRYTTEFTQIVDLCETLISHSPLFSFNIGYTASLYYVACKCRDRILRRRAVALLYQAAPRREVLYNAEQSYKIAVHTIQLEEAGMDPRTMGLPPECSRIHSTKVSRGDPPRPGSRSLASVTFFSKPDGPRGEWKTQTEYMVSTN